MATLIGFRYIMYALTLALLAATIFAYVPAAEGSNLQFAGVSIAHGLFSPRQNPDADVFEKARCKGESLLAAMKASDTEAGALFQIVPPSMRSNWQGDLKLDMSKWGWELSDGPSQCDYSNGTWHFDIPFQALGLSLKPKCFQVKHGDGWKKYTANGKDYTTTRGDLQSAIDYSGGGKYLPTFAGLHANVTTGVLVQSRLSTTSAAEDNWHRAPSKGELPDLRSEADLLWGQWNRDNSNIQNIKYFWSQAVLNANTASVLATALQGKDISGWPGAIFEMSTPQGQALLGSQNGFAFGYFLASHKLELGNKTITKAQVFYGDVKETAAVEDRSLELLFHVTDYNGPSSNSPSDDPTDSDPKTNAKVCSHDSCAGTSCGDPSVDALESHIHRNDSLANNQDFSPSTGGLPTVPVNKHFDLIKDTCNQVASSARSFVQLEYHPYTPSIGVWVDLENRPELRCMAGLYGCVSVVVVSHELAFISHFWEKETIQKPEKWMNDVFMPLQLGGYGADWPPDTGLRSYATPGGMFDPMNTKVFVIHPAKRFDNPDPSQPEHPQFIEQLTDTLRHIGFTDITNKKYDAVATRQWLAKEGETNEENYDQKAPFRTPYGKLLFKYDPNKDDVASGQRKTSAYQLYLGSGDENMLLAEESWSGPDPTPPTNLPDDACSLMTCADTDCHNHASLDVRTFRNESLIVDDHYLPGTGVLPTSNGDDWTLVKNWCNSAADLEIISDFPAKPTVGHQTEFGKTKVTQCMAGLHGCASVTVISRKYVFITHIWEEPSIKNSQNWEMEILDPLRQGGLGSTIPEGKGLEFLASKDQPFDPKYKPKAFVAYSLKRRDDYFNSQPLKETAYPEFPVKIRELLEDIGISDTTLHAYDSQKAKAYFVRGGETDPSKYHDQHQPYQTPFGKILVMYDPNVNDAQGTTSRQAGYQLWWGSHGAWQEDFENLKVLDDTWEALQSQ